MSKRTNRSEDSRLPADDTGGGVAGSPAVAAATRARRARQSRARQGLNSGTTPAATAATVPAITPAAGTAAAMDGGVELTTGEGDPGTLQDTPGVVREAIRVLSRVGKGAASAPTNQVTGSAAGFKAPAQTEVTTMQAQSLPTGAPARPLSEAETAAALAALQSQQQPVSLLPAFLAKIVPNHCYLS